jgi:hypothetical protein
MCNKMPISHFVWLTKDEIQKLDWTTMIDDQETGYIVECDLEYPEDLHKDHNSFPLAPERLFIDESMLSPYARGNISILHYFSQYF